MGKMSDPELVFMSKTQQLLENVLNRFGFSHTSLHTRSRGSVVEFRRDDSRFVISCEGGAVYAELIMPAHDSGWIRVDINALFFHNGNTELLDVADSIEAVLILKSHLVALCGDYLAGERSQLDSRYCFPLSEPGYSKYLEFNALKL